MAGIMVKLLVLCLDFFKTRERLHMFFELGIIDYAIIAVAIGVIGLVAMQNSKEDLGSALTGGNNELFKHQKERGAEVYIVRTTYALAIIYIALAILVFVGIG